MAIRAEYTVEKLPDTYVTYEKHYDFVEEGEDRKGNKIMKMVEKEVESRGGWLFSFFNGSSIRLTDLAQMKQFGLRETPRLIDDTTGQEVNAQGIPLELEGLINKAAANGVDGRLNNPVRSEGGGVESSIANLE